MKTTDEELTALAKKVRSNSLDADEKHWVATILETLVMCSDDTWQCECGRSEPWWRDSNADHLTRPDPSHSPPTDDTTLDGFTAEEIALVKAEAESCAFAYDDLASFYRFNEKVVELCVMGGGDIWSRLAAIAERLAEKE